MISKNSLTGHCSGRSVFFLPADITFLANIFLAFVMQDFYIDNLN